MCDGEPVDYLDGVVFTRDEAYLTLGRKTDEEGPVSDYTGWTCTTARSSSRTESSATG